MYISKMSSPALYFPEEKPGLRSNPSSLPVFQSSSLPDCNIGTVLCLGEDSYMLSVNEVCVCKIYAESRKLLSFTLCVLLGMFGITWHLHENPLIISHLTGGSTRLEKGGRASLGRAGCIIIIYIA